MKHFIDIKDISPKDLIAIISKAMELKKSPLSEVLHRKQLAMIFEKASTRTRFSFEVGINQLGGNAIVVDSKSMQLGRGETIEDTAKVLSRYVDMIMLRTNSHSTILEFAKHSSIPVINALSDRSHPCQVLCDIQTFIEHRGDIKGKKVVWFGDFNNMTRSWIEASEKLDFELVICCPDTLADSGVATTENVALAAKDADLVTTDTWISMGDNNSLEKLTLLAPYQVTQEVMGFAKKEALFMHCLPAHRGEEVSSEVLDGVNSVIFDEAENRLHIQKSIMLWCLGAE
jgi:ornithine carbamoyltransferase